MKFAFTSRTQINSTNSVIRGSAITRWCITIRQVISVVVLLSLTSTHCLLAKAIQYMIVDALLKAEPILHLGLQIMDPAKYVYLTDDVMGMIERSQDEVLPQMLSHSYGLIRLSNFPVSCRKSGNLRTRSQTRHLQMRRLEIFRLGLQELVEAVFHARKDRSCCERRDELSWWPSRSFGYVSEGSRYH